MMKRICLVVFVSIILTFSASMSSSETKKIFYGRLINITEDFIEVKRGKVENIFYFSDKTVYLINHKPDPKSDKASLEICQRVRCYYSVKGTRKNLIKVIIVKSSDCVK